MAGPYRVLCADAGAGGYQAFPDVCRCANGDLLVVFYAGYDHISLPSDALPHGARVCAVRSTDDGATWGPAATLVDTPWDDRDPSVNCLSDGTLLLNWFTYYQGSRTVRPGGGVRYKELWLSRSTDHGATWTEPHLVPHLADAYWGTTSPMLALADGTLLWPIYREYRDPLRCWTAVLRSHDGGLTWSEPTWVDEHNDDCDEPSLVQRPDGSLLCVMRANRGESMFWSVSTDAGLTWTAAEPIGFPGHCPYLHYAHGVLLLGHRLPHTSLHWSLDDGASWNAHAGLELDECIGAYPSLLTLRDGTVLFVYYQEGEGSEIRAQRLAVEAEGVRSVGW